jgi:hypothetical protein
MAVYLNVDYLFCSNQMKTALVYQIYGPDITWTASPTMGIHDGETTGIREAGKPTSLYTKEKWVTCKYES